MTGTPVQSGLMVRDVEIDALRGLLLFIMIVDHLPDAKWLSRWLYELPGYSSAMEGFILISGIVCGLVYSRNPNRAWKRCWVIYSWYAGVSCLIWTAAVAFREETRGAWAFLDPLLYTNPSGALLRMLSMLDATPHAGILVFYVVFLLPLPLVLRGMNRGFGLWILGSSAALWLASQWMESKPFHYGFSLFAWQFLFYAGVFVGYQRARGASFDRVLESRSLLIACGVITFVFFALRHQGTFLPFVERVFPFDSWPISKPSLGWIRVVDTFAIATLLSAGFSRYAAAIRESRITSALAVAGRHSLEVFSGHVLVLFTIALLGHGGHTGSLIAQSAEVVTSIGALWGFSWALETSRKPKMTWPIAESTEHSKVA